MSVSTPKADSPAIAIATILERLSPVSTEDIPLAHAPGRVLAQNLLTDRDSPPCDTSAMDGYALRIADLQLPLLPTSAPTRIGRPAAPLPPGHASYIVTGAPVPPGANAIIRIEDIEVTPAGIRLRVPPHFIRIGQDIRRQGENLPAGHQLLSSGTLLHAPAMAALATFGIAVPRIYRKVSVGILTTGDELVAPDIRPAPWQIRNANAASLHSLFSALRWCSVLPPEHSPDEQPPLAQRLTQLLSSCDLVLLTGGVSMGDHDYVPQTIRDCGCEILFHKLPIRPGKPILAAVGPRGQAVLALPGNPVSVLTTAVRFGSPIARRLAGIASPPPPLRITLSNPDSAAIKLWYSRPVRLNPDSTATLLPSRGSGDIPSVAASDGFVEIPPGDSGPGPWPFFTWEI